MVVYVEADMTMGDPDDHSEVTGAVAGADTTDAGMATTDAPVADTTDAGMATTDPAAGDPTVGDLAAGGTTAADLAASDMTAPCIMTPTASDSNVASAADAAGELHPLEEFHKRCQLVEVEDADMAEAMLVSLIPSFQVRIGEASVRFLCRVRAWRLLHPIQPLA